MLPFAWHSMPRPSECRHLDVKCPWSLRSSERKRSQKRDAPSTQPAHLTTHCFCCLQQEPRCFLKPVSMLLYTRVVVAEGNGLLLLSPELLNSLSFNTTDVKRTHRRFYFGPDTANTTVKSCPTCDTLFLTPYCFWLYFANESITSFPCYFLGI